MTLEQWEVLCGDATGKTFGTVLWFHVENGNAVLCHLWVCRDYSADGITQQHECLVGYSKEQVTDRVQEGF